MKMIGLKLPKKSNEIATAEAPKVDRDQWPYGMQLRFESEQVDKMPHLEKMKVGQKVEVMGMGEVTSIHMREESGGKKKYTIEIQLHEVGCEGKGKVNESMGSMMRTVEESKRA